MHPYTSLGVFTVGVLPARPNPLTPRVCDVKHIHCCVSQYTGSMYVNVVFISLHPNSRGALIRIFTGQATTHSIRQQQQSMGAIGTHQTITQCSVPFKIKKRLQYQQTEMDRPAETGLTEDGYVLIFSCLRLFTQDISLYKTCLCCGPPLANHFSTKVYIPQAKREV